MNPMPTPNETPANGQDAMQEFERLLEILIGTHNAFAIASGHSKGEDQEKAEAALTAHVRKMAEDAERLDNLCGLLASAWLYGGWKAETVNEGEMQTILRNRGWWPITETALVEKRAALRATKETTP